MRTDPDETANAIVKLPLANSLLDIIEDANSSMEERVRPNIVYRPV